MRDFFVVVIWCLACLSTFLLVLAALEQLRTREPVEVALWLLTSLLGPSVAFGVALCLQGA